MPRLRCLLAAGALGCCAGPVAAAPPTPAVGLEWDLRVRHEQVDDAAFAAAAAASTARLRAGLRLAPAPGWSGLVEVEAVGGAGRYNSGANRRGAYPQIMDPGGAELNQAWVAWKGARANLTAGRQRLLFDNQRWIGNSGWRQNEQTFDALALEATPVPALALRHAWLARVHRASGDRAVDPLARERALDTHLLQARWKHGSHALAGYAWLHEDRDLPAASTRTLGLRWTGERPVSGAVVAWTAEAARQRPHAANPSRFSHRYWLAEASMRRNAVTLRTGWEHLGGDGRHALQTPLATLHAFNGWADRFGATPPAGLEDRYLALGASFGTERGGARPAWQLAWHDFRPVVGTGRHGREWDASLAVPLAPGTTAMVKLADYRAGGFSVDTRKLWLQVEYKGRR